MYTDNEIDDAVEIERSMREDAFFAQSLEDVALAREYLRAMRLEAAHNMQYLEMLQTCDENVAFLRWLTGRSGNPMLMDIAERAAGEPWRLVNAPWVNEIVFLFREGAIGEFMKRNGHLVYDEISVEPGGRRRFGKGAHRTALTTRYEYVALVTAAFSDRRRPNDHAGLLIRVGMQWYLFNANDEFLGEDTDAVILHDDIPFDGFHVPPYYSGVGHRADRVCRTLDAPMLAPTDPAPYVRMFNESTVQRQGDCFAFANALFILWNYLAERHPGSTRLKRLARLRRIMKQALASGAPIVWLCRSALEVMSLEAQMGDVYVTEQTGRLIGPAATVEQRCAEPA